MQATLIYNPNSGGINQTTPEQLREALRQVGYHPVYKATTCEGDLDHVLADAEGLIVAAGGDGTIRAVATRLIGKENVSLSILPLGTANNISRTLGVQGTPLEIINGLTNPSKCLFDVGRVRAPWGEDYFLEGAGYGLYADTLALYDPEKGKSVFRGVDAVTKILSDYKIYPSRIQLDGQDISGHYILVEMLNTTAIGPRLKLAPEADPRDGLFEVVCVREDVREQFMRFIMSFLSEDLAELPSVETMRGRKLEIVWTGFPLHVDGEVRPPVNGLPPERIAARDARFALHGFAGAVITIEVLPQAIEFWLPQTSPAAEARQE